jgi:hypothetical protein
MIGPKAMSREIEESDPISSAIGEFRDELLFWIDSALVRLRERVQVDDSVIEEELATAARNSNLSGSSGRLGVSLGGSYSQSGTVRAEPRSCERAVDRKDVVAEAARPPVARPDLQTNSDLRSSVSNPRQRLDALARLLDHRLKQAQGTSEVSGSAGEGTSNDAADEVP